MTVWYVEAGPVGRVAMMVMPGEDDFEKSAYFETNGHPLTWSERPQLVSDVDKRGKRKPRSDISPFASGGLVMSAKAFDALGPFLAKFGQLLELDVDSEPGYFFNPTHLIACIDREHSEMISERFVRREAFFDEVIPPEPLVFKDPTMSHSSRIYANDAGKQVLEDAAKAHGITGLMFRPAGLEDTDRPSSHGTDAAKPVVQVDEVSKATQPAAGGQKMITELFSIKADQLQALIDDPERAEPITCYGKEGAGLNDYLNLEEAWHAIHFMLSGTTWNTEGPLCHAVMGGDEIEDIEVAYLTPQQVKETAVALHAITPEIFAQRFKPADLNAADIYPDNWEGEGAVTLNDILPFYVKLRAFYTAAAERSDVVLSQVQ